MTSEPSSSPSRSSSACVAVRGARRSARAKVSWWSLPGSALVEQLAQAGLPRRAQRGAGCAGAEKVLTAGAA